MLQELNRTFTVMEEYKNSGCASDCEEDVSSSVDSDCWEDEDNSEESTTEDISAFEERFLSLVDHKIKQAERFCDHRQYVLSFAPPILPAPTNRLDLIGSHKTTGRVTCMSIETQTVDVERLLPDQVQSPNLELISSIKEAVDQLRISREAFIGEKKEVGDRLKNEESETDYRWFYECEEAVDAIDTIIEYKNELICGRDDSSLYTLFPDREEARKMMPRLTNILEQERLFCKYFNKVVELRHSTKQLEKNLDHLESENEEIRRRYKRCLKKLREQEEAYEDRCKHLMENAKQPQMGRHDEAYGSHGHKYHRHDQGSTSRNHRSHGGMYDSVRDRDRHRNILPGPEIVRDHRKITIHMPPQQNQH